MDKHTHTLTAVVNDMTDDQVRQLLDLAAGAPIEIISTPRSGLTMMHALDAFDSEFLLGEVLVSRAEVELDGRRGFGMTTCDAPERALARACAEVLLQGDDQLLASRVAKLLVQAQQTLQEKHKEEARLVAATRVNFELMAGS